MFTFNRMGQMENEKVFEECENVGEGTASSEVHIPNVKLLRLLFGVVHPSVFFDGLLF